MPAMPNEVKAPAEQVADPTPAESDVVYPMLRIAVFGTACGMSHEERLAAGWVDTPFCRSRPAMTFADVLKIAQIEDEPAYTARKVAADPKIREEMARFTEKSLFKTGTSVLCLDEHGHKIVSWRNKHNRPFHEGWARRFTQEILGSCWKLNGETIIVGRNGSILSGQKRLVGFYLAVQKWRKDPERYKEQWPTEPTMDCLVIGGIPEDVETIRTLDNVQPRSDADTIYAADEHCQKLSPSEKREYGRMLGKATDFLWKRTGAGEIAGEKVYQTPSENAAFRQRHDKLHKCVKHLFDENLSARSITLLKLSAGESAAMMYLMASGASDGEQYRTGTPRTEKPLDWSLWEKAKTFWTLMSQAGGKDEKTGKSTPESAERKAVRVALKKLDDPDSGTGARLAEKLVVLAKAWERFAANKPFTAEQLVPKYLEKEGHTLLDPDQTNSFGGIDLGPDGNESEEATDDAEKVSLEDAKAAKRREVEQQALANAEKAGVRIKPDEPVAKNGDQKAAKREEQKEKLLADREAKKGKVKIKK